jgi:ketose-bisphosphate aldolase
MTKKLYAKEAVLLAEKNHTVIPAFNVAHIPMLKAIVQAVVDEDSIAMVQVARVEWEKMEAISLEAVAEEYEKYKNDAHTLLHLDHVPVVDEDLKRVDYEPIIRRAIAANYESVMIDGSRLPLRENIEVTGEVVSIAHEAGLPCEAELGAVLGHESGPMPPYEEIFELKKGFTDLDEAKEFALATGVDWLSVAAGNIHGAIADAVRDMPKPEARLDVDHIRRLAQATSIPLVLHGGSGIDEQSIRDSVLVGIAKINVGTEIRQAYENALKDSGDIKGAEEALYLKVREIISVMLGVSGTKSLLYKD